MVYDSKNIESVAFTFAFDLFIAFVVFRGCPPNGHPLILFQYRFPFLLNILSPFFVSLQVLNIVENSRHKRGIVLQLSGYKSTIFTVS